MLVNNNSTPTSPKEMDHFAWLKDSLSTLLDAIRIYLGRV
uniref:Uncharacterized protein n=1 Tax=Arundo donax TaxID=35708 RepID=A0A0A9BVI2_ARUDO